MSTVKKLHTRPQCITLLAVSARPLIFSQRFEQATPAATESERREEDRLLSQRTQRLVQAAAELGAFDLFRYVEFASRVSLL